MSLLKIGRYEILGELGRGAMGVVYEASDPTIGRHVAIKVLSLSGEDEARDMRDVFMREARTAGRLSHPHIVTIHDAEEDPETKSCYIVMEFVAGKTLERLLQSEPPLIPPSVLRLIQQVAEALDYAHRQNVVHRDLKPANILITPEGWVKLTDFGIAKIVARDAAARTATIMGTPSYMSPEQVTGGEVDGRSDLFSLGIILYQMLTRQKPFVGDTAAVMFKIVYEDPAIPSKLNPDLGSHYDYLLLRCLSKARDKRYASARELLDDLEDILNGNPPRSERRVPLEELGKAERTIITTKVSLPPLPAEGSARLASQGTGTGSSMQSPAPPVIAAKARTKGRPVWVGLAVLVMGGAAALAAWNFRQRMREPIPPPPVPTILTDVDKISPEAQAVLDAQAQAASSPPEPKPERSSRAAIKNWTDHSPPSNTAIPANPPRGLSPPPASSPQTEPEAQLAPNPPAPASPATIPPRKIQVYLKHELREGTITISSGSQVLLKEVLKGKKKGGIFGIHGTYEGTFSEPLSLAAGIQDLIVNVTSADGSVKLSKSISTVGATPFATTLNVQVSKDNIFLSWQAAAASAK
jgi:serine/threonine protein kinase